MQQAVRKYGIPLPDRQLACVPFGSPEADRYLAAMRCAANFAFANRQVLANSTRKAFEQVLAGKVKDWHQHQVYDICHNMGKIEMHIIDGERMKVCVHRKGATRAFGPGSPELPDEYKLIGQPVLVPGSMGTASWVLVGTEASMLLSFGSTCHGAGRVMSRTQAKKTLSGKEVVASLARQGIIVKAPNEAAIADEAPEVYKSSEEVVRVVHEVGLSLLVARLQPLGVIKG
jgi:tRNA-splicing ligase RtcB